MRYCTSAAASLEVGGSDASVPMKIDDTELSHIRTEGTITFQSLLGEVAISGITQHAELPLARNAGIQIIASTKTSFLTSSSSFYSLSVTSGEIVIAYDLETTYGNLAFTTSAQNTTFNAGVDVKSMGTLSLSGAGVLITDTSILESISTLSLSAPVLVQTGLLLLRTNTSILITNWIKSPATLDLFSNRDCSGDGYISINSGAPITAGNVNLHGGDVIIQDEIDVGSGTVAFIEECTSSTSLALGEGISAAPTSGRRSLQVKYHSSQEKISFDGITSSKVLGKLCFVGENDFILISWSIQLHELYSVSEIKHLSN